MRKLLIFVLIAALLWCIYWAVVATAMQRGLSSWLEDRATEGWVADYSDLSTAGFPNRFRAILSDIDLADPETGLAWSAPGFEIRADSFRPNKVRVVFSDRQRFASPFQKIDVLSEKMEASITVAPDTKLAFRASEILLDGLSLASTMGWDAHVEAGTLTTEETDVANTHSVSFNATNVEPSERLLADIDPIRVMPATIQTLSVSGDVGFTAPWDLDAIETARPQITAIKLDLLQANWGQFDLWAAGELTVSAEGYPTGEITVKAKNWRDVLEMTKASGALSPEFAPFFETMLDALAGMSGPPSTIDAPLTFRDGNISFGPIPLGRTQPLIIR